MSCADVVGISCRSCLFWIKQRCMVFPNDFNKNWAASLDLPSNCSWLCFFLLNSAKSFPFKSRLYSSVQNVKPHVPSYIPKHHLHVGKQTAPLCIFLNMVVSGSVPREIGGFFLLRFQSVGFTLNGSGEKMVGLKLKNGPKAWRVAPEIHETVRSWVECPILVESSSKPSMQPDPLWIFVTWNSQTFA